MITMEIILIIALCDTTQILDAELGSDRSDEQN